MTAPYWGQRFLSTGTIDDMDVMETLTHRLVNALCPCSGRSKKPKATYRSNSSIITPIGYVRDKDHSTEIEGYLLISKSLEPLLGVASWQSG